MCLAGSLAEGGIAPVGRTPLNAALSFSVFERQDHATYQRQPHKTSDISLAAGNNFWKEAQAVSRPNLSVVLR